MFAARTANREYAHLKFFNVLGQCQANVSPILEFTRCSKMFPYQENQDIRVLLVMLNELKRSRKSPVLSGVAFFCSSSPSGISFRLKAATFWSSSQASFGLLCTSSQRGDSGIYLLLQERLTRLCKKFNDLLFDPRQRFRFFSLPFVQRGHNEHHIFLIALLSLWQYAVLVPSESIPLPKVFVRHLSFSLRAICKCPIVGSANIARNPSV